MKEFAASLMRFSALPLICCSLLLEADVRFLTIVSLLYVIVLLGLYDFDVTNVWAAFAVPWTLILFFSVVEISDYSRAIQIDTLKTIILLLAVSVLFVRPGGVDRFNNISSVLVRKQRFYYVYLFYLGFSALNVALAGYVPLLNQILIGDSGYVDFGVKGLYGFYNAFANALGLTAFYFWMETRDKFYRNVFFSVLFVFIIFMTRQNAISLLVEAYVVYNVLVRKISSAKVGGLAFIAVVGFGLLGDLRVGENIGDLAKISDQYSWVPNAFLWMYSYFYFNVLNLDNVVTVSLSPAYDMSAFAQLVPSFLRPEWAANSDYLEVSSFTVGSFVLPIYRDIGLAGLLIVFSLFCAATAWLSSVLSKASSYPTICSYAVLYFCFLFSFFENFFFYLPVIFQLAFIWVFKYAFLVEDADVSSRDPQLYKVETAQP